jgi:hypothetical protein
MNNAVFGKTMENVRGRIKMELVTQEDKFVRLASKPTFKRVVPNVGNETFRMLEMKQSDVKLDKIGRASCRERVFATV